MSMMRLYNKSKNKRANFSLLPSHVMAVCVCVWRIFPTIFCIHTKSSYSTFRSAVIFESEACFLKKIPNMSYFLPPFAPFMRKEHKT
jgi:hypothetical protein